MLLMNATVMNCIWHTVQLQKFCAAVVAISWCCGWKWCNSYVLLVTTMQRLDVPDERWCNSYALLVMMMMMMQRWGAAEGTATVVCCRWRCIVSELLQQLGVADEACICCGSSWNWCSSYFGVVAISFSCNCNCCPPLLIVRLVTSLLLCLRFH